MVAVSPLSRRSTPRLFAVGLFAAVLFAWIVWFYSSAAQRAAPSTSAPGDESGQATSIVSAATVAPAAADSAREPIDSAAALEPPATADTPAAAVPTNELRGRVVDPADRPVAGARVSLRRGELREFSVLDLELNRATEQIAEATTDASGEFRFELARGIPVDLQVEAQDFCPATIPNNHAGEFVLVRLSAGFRVFGRVTRASDGAPVFDALVRVFRTGGPSSLTRETRSAGNGSYELRITFNEGATLEIVPQVEQCPGWIKLTLDADGQAERNVAVQDGFLVVGKVTAAGSGVPISGATVGEGWVFRRKAQTDAKGEYRLSGFGDPGVRELFAKARGFGQAKREDLPGAVDGVVHVDFELTPARSAHGRVVDPSGAPLQGVLAAAIASEFGAQGQRTDWLSSRTDVSGRFNIENLTPELRHALLLSFHGFATRVYDFPTEELTTADLDLGSFVLGPPALIAGIVQDESAHGLADTEVILQGYNSDRSRLQSKADTGPELAGAHYTDSRRSRSDALGRFSFGDISAGNYSIHARRRGQPQSAPETLTIVEGEQKEHVLLLLPTGSRLHGRVVDPEGRAVAGVSMSIKALESREPAGERSTSARTDAEGKFELTGLSAGDYRLSAQPWSVEQREPDAPLLTATLERVSTASTDELKIVLPRGATIRGALHDAAGAALFGYSILACSPNDAGPMTTTDANGEFCLPVASGSSLDLEVRGPGQNGTWNQVFLVEHAVVAGTRGLKLNLP